MEFPPPPKPMLVRQTADMPIPPVDPVWAAEYSKMLMDNYEAHWKPIMEQVYIKDREWRLANKDMIEAKEAAWEKLIKDGKVFKDMNAKESSKEESSKDA
jgi:hypothetical protein